MVVIYDTDKAEVDEILKCLCLEKDKLNNTGNELQIDYACGWAISERIIRRVHYKYYLIVLILICIRINSYVRSKINE